VIKLENIYKELLFESRRKDIINKYRDRYSEEFEEGSVLSDLAFDSYEHLVNWYEEYLPHQKYLDYALDYSCCGGYGGEPSNIVNLLNDFHRLSERNLIKNKDIYSNEYKIQTVGKGFVNVDKLKDVVQSALSIEIEKDKEKKLKKDRDAIYEDDRWRVIVPRTHEASCHYGAGTRWCTTMKDSPQHFKSYTKNGLLFYLIDKTSRETFNSVNDVMYKLAVNWKWGGSVRENLWVAKPLGQSSVWYDATDNTMKKEHIVPLLPTNLLMAMENHYKGVIKKHNDEVRGGDYELIFNEIMEFLVNNNFTTKLETLIRSNIRKETYSKLNRGVRKYSLEHRGVPSLSTLHYRNGDDYYISLLGSSQMVGHPQLYEIQNSDLSEDDELLLNDKRFWWKFVRKFETDGTFDYNSEDSLKLFLFKNKQVVFDNIDYLVNVSYDGISDFIKKRTWRGPKWDRETKTMSPSYIKVGKVTYWVPVNTSSSYAFKYPPKPNSLTKRFLDAVRLKPGITPKEFYEDVMVGSGGGREYYPGYNAHFFGSLRDSGLVKRKKGSYGEFKYYIGPNYRTWTKGNLVRYNPY
jgi:hypothetical protein